MIASPPTSLTPRQQRYQSDPDGCLALLQGRADRLFEEGYTVSAAAIPLVFEVCHESRNSDSQAVRYFVHALKRNCTCPFVTRQRVEPLTGDGSIVPCKHILGLERLVRRCVAHFKQVNDLYEYLRLLGHWTVVLAEQYRSGSSEYTPARLSVRSAAALPQEMTGEGQKGNQP